MNKPATVDNAPNNTITSNPKIVYGTHEATGFPPTTSGQ
jgi:hypothetical protein